MALHIKYRRSDGNTAREKLWQRLYRHQGHDTLSKRARIWDHVNKRSRAKLRTQSRTRKGLTIKRTLRGLPLPMSSAAFVTSRGY